MSFNSEVVQVLNQLYADTFLSQREPATYCVPVMEQIVPNSNNDNRIYMDHNRLPEATTYTFFGSDVMAHKLNDFAYECMAQNNSGSFHLLNAAGLFSVGVKEWNTPFGPNNDVNVTVNITRNVEGFSYTSSTLIKGNQQAQIFLSPGDMFNLSFSPELNTSNNLTEFNILGTTEFMITRLSRNPYYTPSMPINS